MTAVSYKAEREADDAGVIARAAAGDEAAFAEIIRANHDDMRRVCVVVVGDERVAEDAVEAAWAVVWRKLGSLREPSRLRPWLVSIAVNEARQLVRAQRRRAVTEVRVGEPSEYAGGHDPATGVDAIDLRNALNRLDPSDRALLAMRYVAGFDATELGIATGRSASGTRARLGRLLQRLEKELQ